MKNKHSVWDAATVIPSPPGTPRRSEPENGLKQPGYFLALLFFLGLLSCASIARAATADAVVAWGNDASGQATVPLAAQSGVRGIAAGGSYTVALKNDGSVVAWGYNAAGQVTGTPTALYPYSATANSITLQGEVLSGVMAIAAGGSHTVTLKSNGNVLAWGANAQGQVTGTASTNDPFSAIANPMILGGKILNGITAIAAGDAHTVALKNDGSVVAWGYNTAGQVTGIPTTTAPYSAIANPVTLKGQVLSRVIAIAAGVYHSVALRSDGSVVVWGSWEDQTAPVAAQSGVTAIAAGYEFTVALKNDGSVVASGLYAMNVPMAAQSGVVAIAAGEFHVLALKNDGSVVVWGKTPSGLSLDGTDVPANLSGVAAIAAGFDHSVALAAPKSPAVSTQPISQAVALWQRARFHVTATGYPLSYQWRKDGIVIEGATSDTYEFVAESDATSSYTVRVSNILGSVTSAPPAALTVTPAFPGSVVVWGGNGLGQATVPLAAQSGILAVAAGGSHTLALKADGTLVSWGEVYDGTEYVASPAPSSLSGVTAIAAGANHSAALKTDGSVVAWGFNGLGQTNVPAAAHSGVTAIAAGANYTVALKADGSVLSWGANVEDLQVPVPVEAQSGVMAIAAGYDHTVALKSDGSVVAWGYNYYGQANVPAAAKSGVIAIAAGINHTAALKSDGSVLVWGSADQTAVPPAAMSGVTAIAAGDYHTLALKADGSVVAWGFNDSGQSTVPKGLVGVTAIAGGSGHSVALLGAVSLEVMRNGTALILSWPVTPTGFTLQSTLSLAPPQVWADFTPVPTVGGARYTVTNASSGGGRYFRLRKR